LSSPVSDYRVLISVLIVLCDRFFARRKWNWFLHLSSSKDDRQYTCTGITNAALVSHRNNYACYSSLSLMYYFI